MSSMHDQHILQRVNGIATYKSYAMYNVATFYKYDKPDDSVGATPQPATRPLTGRH
jgi:hypothetical protein